MIFNFSFSVIGDCNDEFNNCNYIGGYTGNTIEEFQHYDYYYYYDFSFDAALASTLSGPIVTSSNHLTLVFQTDLSITGLGFKICYRFID